MAKNPNISRLSDRDEAIEANALESLLMGTNPSAFENRLYKRGEDMSKIRHFKYPLELMSHEAHMGAMMFEIYDTNPQYLATKRNRINIMPKEDSKTVKKAQAAAQKGVASNEIDIVGAASAAVEGAGNQMIAGAELAFTAGVSNPQRSNRLARNSFVEEATGVGGGTSIVDTRIYLYIPNNIQADYGFEYETTDMASLDSLKLPKAMAEGSAEAANAIAKKIAMSNMKKLEGTVSKIPGVELADGVIGKSIEASQRQIVNPMQLHLFKQVKRRSFSFAYTFLPKSREEMMNCHAIMNLFKFYSHPATSGAGRFLDYPAEFQIRFINTDKNNNYFPYILKCALTGMKVTYGEETVMSTFMEDQYGAPPTKIKMELSFDELEILTRDRFDPTPGAANP